MGRLGKRCPNAVPRAGGAEAACSKSGLSPRGRFRTVRSSPGFACSTRIAVRQSLVIIAPSLRLLLSGSAARGHSVSREFMSVAFYQGILLDLSPRLLGDGKKRI